MTLQEIERLPIYSQKLKEIQDLKKVELHAHLGGAVSIGFLQKHCTNAEYHELSHFLTKIRSIIDYQEGFKAFGMIGKILCTNQLIQEAAYDFCKSQYEDKVVVAELRTGLKKLDGNFEDYLKAVLTGLKRGMQDYPVIVTLLLSLKRDTPLNDANEMVNLAIKYQYEGVRGLDVSAESTKGNGNGIFEPLERAKKEGLRITLHIGENREEQPNQQMKELEEIQPDRIGHAVFLCPEAQQWIQKRKVVVGACIRSACSVMITKPSEHPAFALYANGHPVVFCSDDSTLFGNLSEELALVACLCEWPIEKMEQMQQSAKAHIF